MDYVAAWKFIDALRDCTSSGVDCQYALGAVPQQRYMGTWSEPAGAFDVPDQEPVRDLGAIVCRRADHQAAASAGPARIARTLADEVVARRRARISPRSIYPGPPELIDPEIASVNRAARTRGSGAYR
jgi:hypothetical protein